MKFLLLFFILFSSPFLNAQSLRNALFSGKLKMDTGVVIRKTDDLSKHIDTSTKKPMVVQQQTKSVVVTDTVTGATYVEEVAVEKDIARKANSFTPKDNAEAMQVYMDTLVSALKTEVLTSSKVKKGTYYVIVNYTIGADGKVEVGDILVSPENTFLMRQVQDRMTYDVPTLQPTMGNTGKPIKVKRKYNVTLVKE